MQPILDENFIPAIVWTREFLKTAQNPISIAIERENDLMYRYDTRIGSNAEDNRFYIERLVKMILWTVGRRLANATYAESHGVDNTTSLMYAMDLTPLVEDKTLDMVGFAAGYIDNFAEDVRKKIMGV